MIELFSKNIILLKLKTHKYIEKYINISITYTYRLKYYLLFSIPAYFLKRLESFTWLLINSKRVMDNSRLDEFATGQSRELSKMKVAN